MGFCFGESQVQTTRQPTARVLSRGQPETPPAHIGEPPPMFELTKCDGPACPRCGCTDAEIIEPARGGFARGSAVCNY